MSPGAPEAWRPRFHVTGERNWINDPNGPFEHHGVVHLFYQANPAGPFWAAPHWGHVTSTDLVRWTRAPTALVPEPGGPDADGCWSGCTRVVGGRPAIYYTGVVGEDEARVESVCRAWGSGDLETWTKDPANPLVAGPPPELGTGYHRDPYLWRDAGGWHMLLGSGTRGPDAHGTVLRYDSPDATDWRFGGVFFERPRWDGGLDVGVHWECPQLLLDGDRAALVVSCQVPDAPRPLLHAVVYVGSVREGRFEGALARRLDHGDVVYAPAVMTRAAGRTLMWGWAQERLAPAVHGTLSHAGALTLPRDVVIAGDRLRTRPVPELDGLRTGRLGAPEDGFAAEPQMELAAAFTGSAGVAGWLLEAEAQRAAFLVDLDGHALTVAIEDGTGERRFRAPLHRRADHELRVFADGSLLEVFADDGEGVVTTRGYAAGGGWSRGRLTREGDVRVREATARRLTRDAIDAP